MSVIVEFTVGDGEFALGEVLKEPEMHIQLERIVPTGGSAIPFLWVQGDDYDTFERRVQESEYVENIVALDRFPEGVLYRVEWKSTPHSLLYGLNETGGTILEAHGNSGWWFQIRFTNHDSVSQFYNYCTDHDITIHIDRSYTLTEKTDFGQQFGLSQAQRETLVLGLREGYFETPSKVSLSELASELGISQQAVSNRIRRGTEKVLREALLSSATDYD